MTSCSWIMPACTREKESKKQSQRAAQRCSTFQPIVQTSTPSNSSLPNSNPSCARSPPILSKASHSRSTACARPSSLASTRSHVQNAPHISPIRGMGSLNGKCSSLLYEYAPTLWVHDEHLQLPAFGSLQDHFVYVLVAKAISDN